VSVLIHEVTVNLPEAVCIQVIVDRSKVGEDAFKPRVCVQLERTSVC